MSDGGKGSTPRPIPNWNTFSDNFDAIFGKKNVRKSTNTEIIEGQKAGGNSRADSHAVGDKQDIHPEST